MAVYMIVLGFRAQMIERGRRILSGRILQTTWERSASFLVFSARWWRLYLLYLGRQIVFGWDGFVVWADLLALIAIVFAVEMLIQRIWPDGGQRHRTLGRFTMIIYCILFVTGTTTYTMLYIILAIAQRTAQ